MLIQDLRSNYRENGGILFIFEHFEIPRCEKIGVVNMVATNFQNSFPAFRDFRYMLFQLFGLKKYIFFQLFEQKDI